MLCPGSGFWKNTIILFFLLTSTIYGFSQDGMIKGSVSDAESKESLAGANIIAASNKSWQGTASRNDGGFEFRDQSAGTYVLMVSYIGSHPTITDQKYPAAESKKNDNAGVGYK